MQGWDRARMARRALDGEGGIERVEEEGMRREAGLVDVVEARLVVMDGDGVGLSHLKIEPWEGMR